MMRTETGLVLYLLLAGQPGRRARMPAVADLPHEPRPRGQLIWLVAGSADQLPEIDRLIAALTESGVGARVLVTLPDWPPEPARSDGRIDYPAVPDGVIRALGPADTQSRVRAFVDHWHPDVVALIGGHLQPGLIHQLHLRDIPIYHFNADVPRLAPVAPRWLHAVSAGLMRSCLRRFTGILARGPDAARGLIRAGAPAHLVDTLGILQDGPGPLPHAEAERDAMVQLLGPRPVWLAVNIPQMEEDRILAAHEAAQRHSHRLLLILVPQNQQRGAALAERLQPGLSQRVARRGAEEYPDEETSIYIADTEDELGLWFRLATIAFFGGTLTGDAPAPGPHPFSAAALGSAVVFGPNVPAEHRIALGDLAAGQGARMIRNVPELAETIGDLLAPEKAATQALNAWQVISDREAATERATRLLRDALAREAAKNTKAHP